VETTLSTYCPEESFNTCLRCKARRHLNQFPPVSPTVRSGICRPCHTELAPTRGRRFIIPHIDLSPAGRPRKWFETIELLSVAK
jgi:hypothetical protein